MSVKDVVYSSYGWVGWLVDEGGRGRTASDGGDSSLQTLNGGDHGDGGGEYPVTHDEAHAQHHRQHETLLGDPVRDEPLPPVL